jgi:hypothetical protein
MVVTSVTVSGDGRRPDGCLTIAPVRGSADRAAGRLVFRLLAPAGAVFVTCIGAAHPIRRDTGGSDLDRPGRRSRGPVLRRSLPELV